jgi:hypothetical protein
VVLAATRRQIGQDARDGTRSLSVALDRLQRLEQSEEPTSWNRYLVFALLGLSVVTGGLALVRLPYREDVPPSRMRISLINHRTELAAVALGCLVVVAVIAVLI